MTSEERLREIAEIAVYLDPAGETRGPNRLACLHGADALALLARIVRAPTGEAQAQALCMATNDFHRAYHAFVQRETPRFEGD